MPEGAVCHEFIHSKDRLKKPLIKRDMIYCKIPLGCGLFVDRWRDSDPASQRSSAASLGQFQKLDRSLDDEGFS